MSIGKLWRNLTSSKWRHPDPLTRPGQGEFDQVAPYYDHLMRTVPYKHWVDYVETLLRRHQVQPRTVLDLACGTGQVGAEMLRRGYEVVGVDLSESMVRQCSQQTPPLPAAVMDAQQLGLALNSLDLVVSLYDSLNYIVEPAGLQSCWEGVNYALHPGGLFVFDLNTERALRTDLFSQSNTATSDPLQYRWKSYWDAKKKLCRIEMWFQWRGGPQPVEFTETHYERAYDEDEVRQMLAAAGFDEVAMYNAYTMQPPTHRSNRVYYVAEKPT